MCDGLPRGLEERHGAECAVSLDEGLTNRAFARVSSDEVEHIVLQITGVEELVNTDRQGSPAKVKKEVAFYLENHKDVIFVYDEEAEEDAPWFILSVDTPLEEGWEDIGSTDEDDDVNVSDLERIKRKMQTLKISGGRRGRDKKTKSDTHKKPKSTKNCDDMSICIEEGERAPCDGEDKVYVYESKDGEFRKSC